MRSRIHSSRRRFSQYKRDLKQRLAEERERSAKGEATGQQDPEEPRRYQRQRSFWELFRRFVGLLEGHRMMLAAALAALTVSTLIGLLPIYGTKLVFDSVLDGKPIPPEVPSWLPLPTEPRELLTAVALGMVALSLAALCINLWSRWQATRITKRVQVETRRKVFEHAVRLPLHRVYELKSGGAASLLRDDAGGVAELIFAMIFNPWRAIIQLVGSLTILTLTDWRMLLVSLVILPMVVLTHRTWIGRIRPMYRDIRSTRQGVDAHATEAFGGMRVVRSFARQRSEAGQFTRNNHLMARQEINVWWWSRGVDIAWSIFIPAATAALLWYGGRRILEGHMTTGDLVMFLTYLGWLLGPLEMLAHSATAFQNHLAGLDRVLNLLQEPIEMPSREGAIVVSKAGTQGRITLRHVSFAYPVSDKASWLRPRREMSWDGRPAPPETPAKPAEVLHGVNLDVAPGQMVALVGPSGSGKTTLCNLIARFYDPTAGSILLDGIDLRDIEVDSYRRLLGIVEQDTFLFDGTIAENIGYGRRDATREQIMEAAKQANAHGFITTLAGGQGYETLIGERGVRLSGGQRQRLTIARALLADPRILILDEATSNLDTESERLIQASLKTLMASRTSFVIAHRLSTIAHADWIVVLEGGRVIEHGRHTDLMRRSGRYRQMVELQTQPPAPAVGEEPVDAVAVGAGSGTG